MKVIFRTRDLVAARVMASYLQAHGVDARLLDAETSAMINVVGGVRLAVDDEDAAQARRLLEEKGVVAEES